MESKNKKRAVTNDEDAVEDEMKMEKFYSLLRSFRDARERRRRELQDLEKDESNKKKMKTNATAKGKAEEASFEWQDFTTDIHFRKPPLVFPNPIPCGTTEDSNKGKKKKKEHALDLGLAL